MKNITKSLMLLAILFSLSGCKTNSSIPQQVTSLNTDCKTQDVQVSDELEALNGEHTWIAKCNGKTYTCNYFPESGSDCYELTE